MNDLNLILKNVNIKLEEIDNLKEIIKIHQINNNLLEDEILKELNNLLEEQTDFLIKLRSIEKEMIGFNMIRIKKLFNNAEDLINGVKKILDKSNITANVYY